MANSTTPTSPRRSRRPAAPDADEVPELVTALLTASRVLVGVSARSLAQVEDTVTVTQLRTLVVLDSHPGINLNGLAEILDVTPSTAMRMIDRLLVAQLASRQDNPANRREVLLALTQEGRSIVNRVTATRRAAIARIVTAMPAARRTEMIAALRAFADAAGEPVPNPASTETLGW